MRKLCLILTATVAVMGAMIVGRSHAAVIGPYRLAGGCHDLISR
jgi:hypothetical protein